MIHVEQQLHTYYFCTVTLGVILCMYLMLLTIYFGKKKCRNVPKRAPKREIVFAFAHSSDKNVRRTDSFLPQSRR